MTDQIERERKAFEAWAKPNGYACIRDEGGYKSVTQYAWNAWLARAQAERGVSVEKLEALAEDWTREALGLSGVTSSPTRHAMYGCAYDLRALLTQPPEENGE